MRLDFLGTENTAMTDAFFDASDNVATLSLVSASSTEIVFENTVDSLTTTTTVTGTGLSFSGGQLTSGTITGFSFAQASIDQMDVSDISWSVSAFNSALSALSSENYAPMAALFSLSSSIVMDASAATGGFAPQTSLTNILPLVTSPIEQIGSNFYDRLMGGAGDDTLNPGSSTTSYDRIYGSLGDDTLDFSTAPANVFHDVLYGYLASPVTISINGVADTGTVTGSGFTDTFVDVQNAIDESNGLGVWGTEGDDTFNVTVGDDQWFTAAGMGGSDVYNLSVNSDTGYIRLAFTQFWLTGPSQGVDVNLTTGVIANNGYGETGAVNVLQQDGRIELRGTDNDDVMIGGAGTDGFITRLGNDTVDGMGGFDLIRYDRSGVTNVTVDLAAGSATGTWSSTAFTDTLMNIEWVRGSFYADTLLGDEVNNYFEGNYGNDSIDGRGGMSDAADFEALNQADATVTALADASGVLVSSILGDDTLTSIEYLDFADGRVAVSSLATGQTDNRGGGADNTLMGTIANDTITGLNGDDTLTGGMGDDLVRGGKDVDVLYGGAGEDILRGQRHADTLYGGEDDDNVKGGGGNDTLYGDGGNDFLKGGTRVDEVYGGEGNDKLFGNSFDDLLVGGAGDDTVNAGGDNDTLVGGEGDDYIKGGSGFDTFVFDTNHGADRIVDFDFSDDTLQFSAALANGDSATDIAAAATIESDGVLIDFGGSSILLMDLTTKTGLADAIDII